METNIGKKVIIRGDRSGVEFGTLVAQNGREVTLHNARRLWYWDGAASLSQLAKDGTTIPRECKFSVSEPSISECFFSEPVISECICRSNRRLRTHRERGGEGETGCQCRAV